MVKTHALRVDGVIDVVNNEIWMNLIKAGKVVKKNRNYKLVLFTTKTERNKMNNQYNCCNEDDDYRKQKQKRTKQWKKTTATTCPVCIGESKVTGQQMRNHRSI